jgi:hypothetical protein
MTSSLRPPPMVLSPPIPRVSDDYPRGSVPCHRPWHAAQAYHRAVDEGPGIEKMQGVRRDCTSQVRLQFSRYGKFVIHSLGVSCACPRPLLHNVLPSGVIRCRVTLLCLDHLGSHTHVRSLPAALIRCLLERVRPAIKAATRGIRGFCAATFGGKETNDIFPVASSPDDMGPAFKRPILEYENPGHCSLRN